MALCGAIVYYTSNPNQIDEVFRRSGLFRPKWDEMRGGQTYGERTIRFALETYRGQTYRGRGPNGVSSVPPNLRPPHCEYQECRNLTKAQRREEIILNCVRDLRRKHLRPISMGTRDLGELLGVDHSTAARDLGRLEKQGRLKLIVKGKYHPSGRMASVYELPEYAHLLPTTPEVVVREPATVATESPSKDVTPAVSPKHLPPRPADYSELVPVWVWSSTADKWRKVGAFARSGMDATWNQIDRRYKNASYFMLGDRFIERIWQGRNGTTSQTRIVDTWAVPRTPGMRVTTTKRKNK